MISVALSRLRSVSPLEGPLTKPRILVDYSAKYLRFERPLDGAAFAVFEKEVPCAHVWASRRQSTHGQMPSEQTSVFISTNFRKLMTSAVPGVLVCVDRH